MIARNTPTITMIQATMAPITSTSITDICAADPVLAGGTEAPPSCRLVFTIGESTVGRAASESGAAGEVCVAEGWEPIIEVRVDGESGESEGDGLKEGWGPIKKVCVDDEDGESEGGGLKEGWLSAVPVTAGAAVEATEVVEAECRGGPDAAKLSSLVAIQLAADPTRSPFT